MAIVRTMTKADIEAVYDLECRSFSVPWSLDSLKKEIENKLAYYVVVEEDGAVAGYGGLWGVLGEGEVINIAVAIDYRGKGYGQLIMESLLDYSKEQGFERITLEVRYSNEVAKKLYIKNGFHQIAVRKNYYQKPTEDAIIMAYEVSK
ncbi:ribosomal protein S18-alanine N-acetyltransferase [Cellulosilyticum ruminicola]|uniref:ribosomal protein S18-alanine N-acetyltransferase n=1 Tax=Cellulosilyticum ruminicola TaxID=425254 RepID=UPI0006D0ED70|nr:ribosomal protein S18-alanine N-acetyltransferase [Cellulosilyticum ruminicola]